MLRKICIIGLEDYPMLLGGAHGYIGGESVQHVLLAQAWRDLGIEVSIVVYDCGQPHLVDVAGIKAVSAFREDSGLRGVRFFTRLHNVIRAMKEIDADVYYQSPASPYTGLAAWFARRHGKLSIARIASDLACIPGQQRLQYQRDRKLYEYGLRNASLVAAQTEQQRALLREHYGRRSEVVNMLVELPERRIERPRDIDVLWVGNLRPVKRPQLAFELARRLPAYKFVFAGGPLPRQDSYYRRMLDAARELPNIVMLGPTPYPQVGALFDRAIVHLNTSSAEGFPNTFLQAWAHGVPVVSFFDPDAVIRRRALGRTVSSIEQAADALAELLRNRAARDTLGENGRRYVQSHFSAQETAKRYLELLEQIPIEEDEISADILETKRNVHARAQRREQSASRP